LDPSFFNSLFILIKPVFSNADMSSTAFIEPLPVIDFVTQLLNRDVSARPLSDADRVKVRSCGVLVYIVIYNSDYLLV